MIFRQFSARPHTSVLIVFDIEWYPMKASVRIALLMLALAALSGCAHLANRDTLPFRGLETPPPRHFNGVLTLPEENKDSVPVVVLVHGTARVDNRYAFHRPAWKARDRDIRSGL